MLKALSKYEQIYDYLMSEMAKRDIGELLPCETDLAAKLHVNRMTVSKVMSALKSQGFIARKQGRGSTIIKKVQEEVKGLISVLPGTETNIKDSYFSTLMQVVSKECIDKGYVNTFTGCLTQGKDASFDYNTLNSLASSGQYVGAVILDSKTRHLKEWKANFKYNDFPVVWTAMPSELAQGMSSVDIDNRAAAVRLVEHLYAQGHRRIGFISTEIDSAHRRERYTGYREALERLNLRLDESLVIIQDYEQAETGYKAAEKLARLNDLPDALFVAQHPVLQGIKKFEEEHKTPFLSILPVATFDYEFTGEFENVAVSVRQPFEQMGKEAFELVLKIKDGTLATPASKVLKAEIITKE